MPITGSQKALMYSLSGVLRSGAGRSGYHSPATFIAIDGVARRTKVRTASLTITDILNETPSRCSMTVHGFTPSKGDAVRVMVGSTNGPAWFAGHALAPTQIYDADNPVNVAFQLSCSDDTWLLNSRKVTRRYLSTSVTDIAIDLLTIYAPTFSSAGIVSGLPVLDEITFTNEEVTDCFSRLAKRIGGYWKVVDPKIVRLFITDVLQAPVALTAAHPSLRQFQFTEDLGGVITRVTGEGGGANATVPRIPGDTTIPIEDAAWYTSGIVVSGPQHLTYTGKVSGGTGSAVAGIPQSPGTLTAADAVTSGRLSVGAYTYKVSFAGPSGVSEVSAASNTVTLAAVAAPGAPTTAINSSQSGRLTAGVQYFHRVTFVNANGETVGGTASSPGLTIPAITPPGAATVAVNTNQSGRLTAGSAYFYKIAFVNGNGETIGGTASASVTVTAVTAPGAPLATLTAGVVGNVTPGNHTYKVSFVNANGETLPGSASGVVTATAFAAPGALTILVGSTVGQLGAGVYGYKVAFVTALGETTPGTLAQRTSVIVAAPSAPTVGVVSSTIGYLIGAYDYKVTFVTEYGETTGGSTGSRTATATSAPAAATIGTHVVGGPLIGTYLYKIAFVSAVGETIGTASSSTSPVASVATAPTLAGGAPNASDIGYAVTYVHPVFGESALSSRVEYDGPGGTITVTVVNLPTGCGWNVYSTGTVAEGAWSTAPLYKVAEVGVGVATFDHTTQAGPAEGVRPALGKSIPLTSIPTGPTGTLARRIYRTKNGGSSYFLVGELPDNSTTTFTDGTPDSALTAMSPIANLNGQQHDLTGIATGPTGTIARRIYRTKAGGSTFYLLTEIPDNATTTFIDNAPDTALTGATIPLVHTAGADQHALIAIPMGATGTLARRLYRTTAGGSDYKFLTELGDNFTTTFTDNTPDSSLGVSAPLVNTAGDSQVSLTGIPTGPTGTTSRRLYRTLAGGSVYYRVGTLGDNSATTFTDNVSDTALQGNSQPLTVSQANGGQVDLTAIPLGLTGTTKRKIYRTIAGGSTYKYVATLHDNTTTVYLDNVGDTSLGADILAVSTADGGQIDLTAIPLGIAGTTKRKVYRAPAGGIYKYVATINDNTTAVYLDNVADTSLGADIPATTTADGGQISLSAIPLGPAGTTKRYLYRTAAGGALYRLLATINDNTTVIYTDNIADASLGEEAPGASAWATPVASTTLRVLDLAQFPAGGWARVASQVIRYTGGGGGAGEGQLTGVPTSGTGSIIAPIAAGASVVVEPHLTGIPASGVGSILWSINAGDPVNIWVQRDATSEQVALAALLGTGDGIREDHIQDRRLSQDEIIARCDALLDSKKDARAQVTYQCQDVNAVAGATITVNLGAPTNVSGTFKIQQVTIGQFQFASAMIPKALPWRTVQASNERFSLEDLLRQRRAAA